MQRENCAPACCNGAKARCHQLLTLALHHRPVDNPPPCKPPGTGLCSVDTDCCGYAGGGACGRCRECAPAMRHAAAARRVCRGDAAPLHASRFASLSPACVRTPLQARDRHLLRARHVQDPRGRPLQQRRVLRHLQPQLRQKHRIRHVRSVRLLRLARPLLYLRLDRRRQPVRQDHDLLVGGAGGGGGRPLTQAPHPSATAPLFSRPASLPAHLFACLPARSPARQRRLDANQDHPRRRRHLSAKAGMSAATQSCTAAAASDGQLPPAWCGASHKYKPLKASTQGLPPYLSCLCAPSTRPAPAQGPARSQPFQTASPWLFIPLVLAAIAHQCPTLRPAPASQIRCRTAANGGGACPPQGAHAPAVGCPTRCRKFCEGMNTLTASVPRAAGAKHARGLLPLLTICSRAAAAT
jgi:hypothetical protein